MNNNSQPVSESAPNPAATDYSNQQFQNSNCYFYSSPDYQMFLRELNFYQIYSTPILQNIQNISQQMNTNNDKNNIPLLYNLYYNNLIHPINAFQLFYPYINQGITQLNYGPNSDAPTPSDTSFLNKKRSDTLSFEKEKPNLTLKPEDKMIQNKEAPKVENIINNLDNNETKVISKEENIIKVNKKAEKENIKKDDNSKDINTQTTTNLPKEKEKKEEEKKKGKRKKRISEELLKDTFLEHIGKSMIKSTVAFEEDLSNIKTKSKKPNTKKNKISKARSNQNESSLEEKTIDENSETREKDKNKKLKSKNARNQKKKQHKITIKNNNNLLADLIKGENNEKSASNHKLTKVNFHGENYENTISPIDFMKYNFDFQIEEQYKTKKLITDYEEQHIDMAKMSENFYENYNYNGQNLDQIEQKWSRKKFNGDNRELKKVISIIRDSFPGRKVDTNEEKCLNILKKNDYNIEGFLNSKHCK